MVDSRPLVVRSARADDLPNIVALLADDPLGATREVIGEPLHASYYRAFDAIDTDPNNFLLVLSPDQNGPENSDLLGVLQLTLIPNLTYRGAWRATIEGVRIARGARGQNLGRRLVQHAIQLAKERGCRLVQLTTNKSRPDALRFYESLGFEASHEGLKLDLGR